MPSTKRFRRAAAVAAAAAVMSLSPFTLTAGDERTGGTRRGARFWGTWYAELDAEPFGLPPGAALASLMTIHRDGTLQIFDAGDFGAAPISLMQSAQFGSWKRSGRRSIMVTTLFFAGDPESRDTTLVKRVRFRLAFAGNDFDRLVGSAETVEQLECPVGVLPGFLSCPNPITASPSDWMPEPGGAPSVRFEAWRLHAR
jgi:hypothetical protein